jgi:oxygen-dependent protoporphyrinogen oxidase
MHGDCTGFLQIAEHPINGITAEPLFTEITRCHRSMPQYPIGHPDQLKEWRTYLAANMPGLALCGAGYEGVGIPDCVHQGKRSAEQMLTYLTD